MNRTPCPCLTPHLQTAAVVCALAALLLGGCAEEDADLRTRDAAADHGAGARRDAVPAADSAGGDVTPAGDGRSASCVPAGIAKLACPWNASGSKSPCPAGQVCRAYSTCVVPGCSDAARCKVPAPAASCFWAVPRWTGYPPTQELKLTATATRTTGTGGEKLTLGDAQSGMIVQWNLPAGMDVPIKNGDSVQLEACPAGNGINRTWVAVLRDATGKLLMVGGSGIDPTRSPCLQRAVKTTRADLGCRPRLTNMDPVSTAYTEAFGLTFTGDSGTTQLAMGETGAFTLGGQKLTAYVCDARHPIEWQATDVYGSFEQFVVVAQP